MITIYDKNNKKKLEVGVNEGSIRKYTLMKEDYIRLKFTTTENTPLLIGDYVDLTNYIAEYGHDKFNNAEDDTTKLFVVDRNFFPTYDSNNGGWKYDVQINAYYYAWDNKLFKYISENSASEIGFNLTSDIEQHAKILKDNFDYGGITYKMNSGEDEDGNPIIKEGPIQVAWDDYLSEKGIKWVHYQSVSILGAIKLIAEAFECEWWIEKKNEVHFGIRNIDEENPEEISLTMNEHLAHSSTSKADGVHATRIYPFGGTTNVPKHYRDALEFSVTEAWASDVYDKNKPVKSWMFQERTKMPLKTYKVDTLSTDHSAYETWTSIDVFNIGAINLSAGKHEFNIKNFDPKISFVKVAAHGDVNTEIKVNFRYTLSLTNNLGWYCILSDNTKNTKEIRGKLRDLQDGSSFVPAMYLDHNVGYVGVGGTFRIDMWGNDDVYLFSGNGSAFCAEAISTGKRDSTCLFWTTDSSSLSKNNTRLEALTPYQAHQQETKYSIYVSKIANNLGVWSKDNTPIRGTYLCSKPKKFSLSSGGEKLAYPVIPNDGLYSLVLSIFMETESTQNIVKYGDNYNAPLVVFDSHVKGFSIDYRRSAEKKDTIIKYKDGNGEWVEEGVTINPNYRDDEFPESSMIHFHSGVNPLKVGDKFQFPEIQRNEVGKDHGNWFDAADTGSVKGTLVEKRIMLPEDGLPYVQAKGISDEDAVEAVVTYDWIYPKTDLYVTEVFDGQIWQDGENVRSWAIRIDIKGFTESMRVPDAPLYAIFQNGNSVGLKYELEWLKDNSSWKYYNTDEEITFTDQDFWLKPNTDWGEEIPKPSLVPSVGDRLILDGIEISFFDFNAIGNAEEALKEQAEKDIEVMAKENIVVDVTLRSDYAYNLGRISVGSPVNIKGVLNKDFPSRVIGYEEKLDYMYDSPKYAVSDTNYYSKIGNIESNISEVQKESYALGRKGEGGKSIIIIPSTDDVTRVSETNVYSAKRVEERFVRNDKDGRIEGNVSIAKGLGVGGDSNIGGNASVGGSLSTAGDSHVGGSTTVEGSHDVAGNASIHGNTRIDGELRIPPKKPDEESNTAILNKETKYKELR